MDCLTDLTRGSSTFVAESVTELRTYKVSWVEDDPLQCTIHDALTNRSVLGDKETPEERLKRKELEAQSLPLDNLKRLFRHYHDSRWKAIDLYAWFEENAPGYKIRYPYPRSDDVHITFLHINHAVLFKLTWL